MLEHRREKMGEENSNLKNEINKLSKIMEDATSNCLDTNNRYKETEHEVLNQIESFSGVKELLMHIRFDLNSNLIVQVFFRCLVYKM